VTKVLNWLGSNWYWIAGVLIPILLGILNAATKRFSKYPGAVSWLMFLVDLLSNVRAKGTPNGSILGKAKFPLFQLSSKAEVAAAPPCTPSEPIPTKSDDTPTAPGGAGGAGGHASVSMLAAIDLLFCLLLVAGMLCMTSCASSTLGRLGQLQTSVQGLRQSSTVVLDNRCADLVPKCPSGGLSLCTSYQQCAAARRVIYATASSLQITIDAAASLAALGKDDQAKALLPTISDGLNRLVQQLTFYDVLKAGQTLIKPEATAPPAAKAVPAPVLAPASQPRGAR